MDKAALIAFALIFIFLSLVLFNNPASSGVSGREIYPFHAHTNHIQNLLTEGL